MSTIPITQTRQFEIVTPREMSEIRLKRLEYNRHPAIREAISYLGHEPAESAVKVKVIDSGRLRRMRESAIGFATRRGFQVRTLHENGWLIIQKVDS